MADTFLASANAVPFTATNQSMLALFNGAGSGKILRVYRVWFSNASGFIAVTGTAGFLTLARITAATVSNWAVTPVATDSANASLPAQVTCGSKFTVTTSDVIRRRLWSSDEPVLYGATQDEFQLISGYNNLWNVNAKESTVEPLVLREGQGVSVQNVTYTATAPANLNTLDVFIEFTCAGS